VDQTQRQIDATALAHVLPLDRTQLRGFEKFTVPLMESLNTRPWAKRLLHLTFGHLNALWMRATSGRMWHMPNPEVIQTLDAPHGLILVPNHRSFFDQFIASSMLLYYSSVQKRVAFPTRADFFYTKPQGLLIMIGISGCSMWPPVFRDDRRRELNPQGLQQMAAYLQKGSVLGIHPEGQRNKGDDPYSQLPARAGLGQLVQVCHPDVLILPCFIAGLTNRFFYEITRGFRLRNRGPRVRVWWGAPVRAGDLRQGIDAQGISDNVMQIVRDLGLRDKAQQQL